MAVLGGIATFVGAVTVAWKTVNGERFTQRVSESAALLTGYTDMVKNLRAEMAEMRHAHAEDTGRFQKQCAADMDRLKMMHKYELDSLIAVYAEERSRFERERERMEERVETLEAQVTALLYRPSTAQDRAGDK